MSRALTSTTTLDQLKWEAKGWLKALRAGDAEARARLLRTHPAARLTMLLDAHPGLVSERGTLPGHTGLRTALHFGVAHEPVVRLLLDRGADPNVRDEGDDAFPLHFAAERQDLPVIRLLVEHGADTVGDGTHHELDVLGWATAWDQVAVLRARGAGPSIP